MGRSEQSEKLGEMLARLGAALKARGLSHVVRSAMRDALPQLRDRAALFYHRTFRSRSAFLIDGESLTYFYHEYGRTWRNERCVEVPIIWKVVNECRAGSVLEVGNVLSHYFSFVHDVVDKYEEAEGVIREDIVDFTSPTQYNLIVSISTLEHVGLYENPNRPEKVLDAFNNLRRLLASGGKIVVTLPIGFNPVLDNYLEDGEIQFTKMTCLRRTRPDKWEEADWDDIRSTKYNSPYPNANALVVGMIGSDGGSGSKP